MFCEKFGRIVHGITELRRLEYVCSGIFGPHYSGSQCSAVAYVYPSLNFNVIVSLALRLSMFKCY